VDPLSEEYRELMKRTAQGSFVLILGQVVSTIILAAAQIIVADMLGQEKLGEYTVVFVPISIALLLQDIGLSTGLTSYLARYSGAGDEDTRKTILFAGLAFNVILSIAVATLLFIFTPLITQNFLLRPDLELMLRVASFSVIGHCLHTTTNAIFIGQGRMELQSLAVVTLALIRSILSPLLIYAGYSTIGAVIGHTAATLTTGLMGLTLVLIILRRTKGEIKFNATIMNLKSLLNYGLPVYISNFVDGGLSQFYSSMMVIYASNIEIGNYTVAASFASLVNFVTGSVSTAIFPMFSMLKKDDPNLALTYRSAVKYSSLFALPIVGMLIALSEAIIAVLFGNNYPLSAYYLRLYILIFIYIGLGSVATVQLLNGQGETKISLRAALMTLAAGVPLALLLTPSLGILGLITALIISPLPGTLYGLRWIKRNLGITPEWKSSIKITIGAAISTSLTMLFASTQSDAWVKLIAGASIFMATYLFMVKILRVLDTADANVFKAMLSDRGALTKLGNMLIDFLK
jgi:O-antigen/teichoic acid export membrane protein